MKIFLGAAKIAALTAAAAALSGCAMIFSGFSSDVRIRTSPPGCEVYDNAGKYVGKTPCKANLSKRTEFLVFKKPGYEPQTVYTNRHWAWFPLVCDIIFWPSAIADACSGACYEINEKYYVILNPKR